MRAVRFDEYGDYDVLRVVDVPEPEPAPGHLIEHRPFGKVVLTI